LAQRDHPQIKVGETKGVGVTRLPQVLDTFLLEPAGIRIVILVEGDGAERLEREPDAPIVAGRGIKVEAFFAVNLGLCPGSLPDAEIAAPRQAFGSQRGGHCLLTAQRALEPEATLAEVAACPPVQSEAGRNQQGG